MFFLFHAQPSRIIAQVVARLAVAGATAIGRALTEAYKQTAARTCVCMVCEECARPRDPRLHTHMHA